jgi:mono/diheme cytochrome c family protein
MNVMSGQLFQSHRCGRGRPPWGEIVFAAVAWLLVSSASVPAAEGVDFSREIQPLLAKRCFSCHGPETREGGLRLDDQAGATAALESGDRAIVPGRADESEILERITSTDPDIQMPPEGPRLSASQVGSIRRWIEAGAEWKEHWAFRPLVRPTVPDVGPVDGQAPNPIDAFIRDRLIRSDLPVPPAVEMRALLRRATYDITGLPPTEQEVQEFLADTSPRAWETVVDRLLASPHYGEQWARHWLDLVRYADTNSFERDSNKPHAWRYRDYVIRSLNDDKPYDRFVIEQLAGDELPDRTADSLIATGYYRLGIWDDEPADKLQSRYDWFDDIVATTSQTFLGLTVNCARCHDHKIDPITQRDYYSLLSFFHAITPMVTKGPQIERAIFPDDAARRRYEASVADLEQRRNAAQQAVTAIETQFRQRWVAESGVEPGAVDLDDLSFRFYRDSWTSLPAFDELKPEDTGALPGNLFDLDAAPSLRSEQFGYVFTGHLKVPEDGTYTFTLDSDDGARLTVDGATVIEYDGVHGFGVPRSAAVKLAAGRPSIRLDYFQSQGVKGLAVDWSGPGFTNRSLSTLDANGRRARTKATDAELIRTDGVRLLGPDGKKGYDGALAALEKLKAERVPVDEALVVTESGTAAPDTHVFYRGNPHAEPKPETLVEPAFPAILRAAVPAIGPPADGTTTGRRTALARWIASPENPLTARVVANRIWQHHFGRGIVRSASNFGMMGDPPTHPELLDWLATELIANNWRWKPIHRLILLSHAYRSSSRADAGALAKDPLNDSFWRFDMRRLAAEELRDSIHVAAGGFNPKMYGPGVYPEIPREVMAGQSRPGHGWGSSSPEEQARRSLYIHVKRSLITPLLADFDAADPDTSCPVRFVTTQPTQALGMMNGAFLQQQARVLADRVRREAGGPDAADVPAQVRQALTIALTRPATDEEVARGVALIGKLDDADGVSPSRAMELFCLMVLNLNEFAYLD